jgi:hypothetical protein
MRPYRKFFPRVSPVMFKAFFGICLSAMLSSCATQQEYIPANQDSARIRVSNGTAVHLYIDSRCTDDPAKQIHAAAGGFSYLVPNKRIGMPSTEDMPFSFHEYAIPANRVIIISMYWSADSRKGSTVRSRCGPVTKAFIPQAGHDYDTSMIFSDGTCHVQLRELANVNAEGMATPVLLPPQGTPVDIECLKKADQQRL